MPSPSSSTVRMNTKKSSLSLSMTLRSCENEDIFEMDLDSPLTFEDMDAVSSPCSTTPQKPSVSAKPTTNNRSASSTKNLPQHALLATYARPTAGLYIIHAFSQPQSLAAGHGIIHGDTDGGSVGTWGWIKNALMCRAVTVQQNIQSRAWKSMATCLLRHRRRIG